MDMIKYKTIWHRTWVDEIIIYIQRTFKTMNGRINIRYYFRSYDLDILDKKM